MAETALILSKYASHNAPATAEPAKTRWTDLARLDLVVEMVGQSQTALDAKHRDLRV